MPVPNLKPLPVMAATREGLVAVVAFPSGVIGPDGLQTVGNGQLVPLFLCLPLLRWFSLFRVPTISSMSEMGSMV
jgi:hypothetical protein